MQLRKDTEEKKKLIIKKLVVVTLYGIKPKTLEQTKKKKMV